MSLYRFSAKDLAGKKFAGEVEAFDEKSLVRTLQKEGLVPIEIKKHEGFGLPIISALPKVGAISSGEIVNFTRELSTMISSGLPIADALVILEKQAKSRGFGNILAEVVADIEGGMSLSVSLSKHPKAFDNIYVKLVEAGETGGVLDKILAKLAETLEKEREFKAKTRGAFIYPAIVIIVMVLVMSVMMIFVIPKLTGLYKEIGASLPLPTRVMIAISDFMRNFWWLLLIMMGMASYGLRIFAKTDKGSMMISRIVLLLPIWGKIRKTLILAQFTRTLGLLVGSGIPIIAALKAVA
ncbi:hypothetical protein A2165_00635, partial [Candidatus Curtissbacteria bacterium RBG_13_40_7]